MIPQLIQRQGAMHLADEEAEWPADRPPLNPTRAVLELVPESVCRENAILPLKLEGRTLHVAAADATNILLRDKLTFILNKDVKLIPFPRNQIQEAIDRHYGQTKTETVDSMLVEFNDTSVYSTSIDSEDEEDRPAKQRRFKKSGRDTESGSTFTSNDPDGPEGSSSS